MEPWYYNEYRQVGLDFTSEEEVRAYDEKYKSLRNFDEEADFIAGSIRLKPESEIIEFGTGTGEHSIRLARKCRKVTACDVSITMLEYARKKSGKAGLTNIEFINGGFLNRGLPADSYDAVISQLALHHLPEFWKSVAIDNICRVLKAKGVFYLLDSILSFDISSHSEAITKIINFARTKMGDRIAEEVIINIRDEYPAYDWTIENLLIKSGFTIVNKIKYTDVMSLFVSVKNE
jgi:ubiquinone/menaquinone biosynthesis C-methylase UbiE